LLMANHLNHHLWHNIGALKQTKYTCPETGKTQALGAVGGSVWLQVLGVICNTAQNREYFQGWRNLAKQAGTNLDTARYWVEVLEQIGWLTPNGTHALDKGKRGKPAKCWLVTLPDLPELVTPDLWVAPTQQQPAKVVAIGDHRKGTGKRVGQTSVVAQIGNLAQELVPESAHALQPAPQPTYSAETVQVLESAEACLRAKLADQVQGATPEQTAHRLTMQLEQVKGTWEARYGERLPAVQQVETALRHGSCTESEAVRYLASGACGKTDLVQFVGGTATT
jgi:hypothetical protein